MTEFAQSLQTLSTPDDNEIFLTEIINSQDPRSTLTEMKAAKKAEISNLLDRGTFKVIF